ncbi:MAG: histidine--tRNA ligase [Fimbriimonadaceae bacterium]|nr:histidine--tRNA ligase [Fimbriimonadaceae bacterium]
MKSKYQAPRGTNDIIPGPRQADQIFETHRWQFVESEFLSVAWQYGYEEIRTPMFEDIDLFIRSSGEASDIVSKEMYDFMDKGDRHVALKPEGTAPAMRAYLEHGIGNIGSPTRLCYINHSFRYGRPGKGRYRQLHQLGMELIGSSSPQADAEIIIATYHFMNAIGIESPKVLVNCIGRVDTRTKYAEVILNHVQGFLAEQTEELREKLSKNPVRMLDTKDEKLKAALQGLPQITDFLSDESRTHFEQVCQILTENEIPFVHDAGIVRGLDYYTDTVFEFVDSELGDGLSLCGGGRYDGLIEQLGGKPTPSVGVGIGLERLLLTLEEKGIEIPRNQPDVYLVSATENARNHVQQLARELRNEMFTVQLDIDSRNIKQQFKAADRVGARFAIIIGDDEMKQNKVTIKNLASSEQTSLPQSELAEWLENTLLEITMAEE